MTVACRTGDSGGGAPVETAPTVDELGNATYAGIYEEPVTLSDGRWEGEPFVAGGAARPVVSLVEDLRITGDLNGDGVEDAVVLLMESSGGSGGYVYLAAVARRNGAVVNLGTSLVGDRVQLRDLRYRDGRIVLDVVQHDSDDAACCPTRKATRSWTLRDGQLVELTADVDGTVSIADLEGREWRLTHLGRGDPAPAEPVITLTFDGRQVGGHGGCGRYSATVEETAPQEIAIGAIEASGVSCPDGEARLESRYLSALEGTLRYSFRAGKLALTYRAEDGIDVLLFEAQGPTTGGP
ncbi:MAG: META domain-containing protein [Gemmatimonadetes bacterium]|nr:META domain-containing protein [Gemmatimonadota bacterium]